MGEIDYGGPQGGALAMAFGAGCVFMAGVCVTVGTFIWKYFVQKEREQCAKELADQRDRIKQLETLLIVYGPTRLANQVSAAVEARETAAAAPQDATVDPSTRSTPLSSD